MILTQARLKELLHYDPETGVWTRLVATSNSIRIGDVAGGVNHGYVRISVDGRKYSAHRLAFLYQTGAWPSAEVDHWNLDKADNSWGNLRGATRSQNIANTSTRINNAIRTSGRNAPLE